MGPRDLAPACEGVPMPGTVRVAEGPDAGQPAALDSRHPVAATCRCGEVIRRENWLPIGPGGEWRHTGGAA